ncbi:MIP-T3 domain containing protein [Asbolus verrucosus]|uniref:MIP-T3 domain containing protein n=1 Tax=Asbolus verrucosus TaxID=1661398 RepID=A0A482VK22_ASBVE|nr:MIP-T3 domain containing protein [Asbolus verrucosus]
MLRTRRRDNNVKPNRRDARISRLDRKSSRGMIYENEELRLRTININAEIERGQYDIKKLKRENEMLKKEIWCLRDEYEKLDKLLKEREYDFSSSSTTCSSSSSDSESCSSCTEESEEVETSQNLQNVQKTNMKNLHAEFDHLSVVPEENSTENSDKTSITRNSIANDQWNCDNVIKPDQSYPPYEKASTLPVTPPPKNFFSPIKPSKSCEQFYTSEKLVSTNATSFYQNMVLVPKPEEVPAMAKTETDLIVKTDNHAFNNGASSRSTFSNGGNLEELLNDIETISQDILKITNDQGQQQQAKPFKSELNVVLMPNPMPLLGFDKYRNIHNSFDSLHSKSAEKLPNQNEPLTSPPVTSPNVEHNPFYFGPVDNNSDFFNARYNPENFDKTPTLGGSKTNLLDLTSSELISSENEENLKFQTTKLETPKPPEEEKKIPKLSIRRKVSIHFKGKNKSLKSPTDKKHSIFDIKFGSSDKHQKTPSLESRKSTTDAEPKTPTSSDSKTGSDRKKIDEKKQRKSTSVSPDRKHVHVKDEKKHKKHRKSERMKSRRGTITSMDRLHRERSFSVCTDRSNAMDHRYGVFYDDYGLHSERERTNSLSSCDTVKTRKMSNISNIPLNGKVPWCACWGNGCI